MRVDGMIKEIAKGIHKEVLQHLKSMIDKRKEKAGLVSIRNTMIGSIGREMNKWLKEQYKTADRIEKMKWGKNMEPTKERLIRVLESVIANIKAAPNKNPIVCIVQWNMESNQFEAMTHFV